LLRKGRSGLERRQADPFKGQLVRSQAVKTISAVDVASAIEAEKVQRTERSQVGIIVISDFVMKVKLHETR
jgi:hypothetical protein